MIGAHKMMASGGGVPYQVARWDAAISTSYDGSSQYWNNIAIPADGELASTLNMFLGNTVSVASTDPTFNGSAGGMSANEYWSFDGGDFFRIDAPNTTFLHSLHKNNAQFTLVLFLRTGTTGGAPSAFCPLITTAEDDGPDIGIAFGINTDGALRFTCYNGAGSARRIVSGASYELANSTDYMISMSLNETTGACIQGVNLSFESTTGKTYSSPSASNSTNDLRFMSDGVSLIAAATDVARLYQIQIFNAPLSTTDLTALYNTFKARYSLP